MNRIETGRDANGRAYADAYRGGRLWRRFTSNGVRPFASEAEAERYARAALRRIA